MKKFLEDNKVLIAGLAAALLPIIQGFITSETTDWKLIAYAIVPAALGYFGNNLRGQWAAISTNLGTLTVVFATMELAGQVNYSLLLLHAFSGFIGLFLPPQKSKEYEQSPTIQNAKQEAVMIKQISNNEDEVGTDE